MKFRRLDIPDVLEIQTQPYADSRGEFVETFRQDLLERELGYKLTFVQENQSISKRNVIRGLHYQERPFSQAKLVRVVKGRILDVALDLRKDSATFGKHVSQELSCENYKQLFIPHGFAHGFATLSETAIVVYKVDSYYNKESEKGVKFNDPQLKIDWKVKQSDYQVSDKDLNLPLIKDNMYRHT